MSPTLNVQFAKSKRKFGDLCLPAMFCLCLLLLRFDRHEEMLSLAGWDFKRSYYWLAIIDQHGDVGDSLWLARNIDPRMNRKQQAANFTLFNYV